MEVKKEMFDAFIEWLKKDGLIPKRSERLWKKAIFINLKNDDSKTIENYIDFMKYVNKKKLPVKKDIPVEIDYFDYDVVINQNVVFDSGTKKILQYIDTEGFLHLFFDDNSNDFISKEVIRKIFSKISHK